jgi:Thiolase, N-terminal domain
MPDTTSSVIVAGARTPMGRLLGSLKELSGSDLGAIAIRGALAKAGVSPEVVQYVNMGQVLTAGAGQIPARQAAVAAGIPMGVPALTINKVCLSGIDAIALADQLIRAGEFEVIVAGGQESMSRAPHLLTNSREGFKYGDTTMRDHMAYDGLHDIFTDRAMGNLTELKNQERGHQISREEQMRSRRHRIRMRRGRGRTGCSTTRLCRYRFPSGRAIRSSSHRTRAFARTPRCRRWRDCGRRSPQMAPSPRATRRRSPTVRRRWC